MLGKSRGDMRERIDSIAAFADIGEFRCAPPHVLRRDDGAARFATATMVDADILLVDEARGVGDAAFQQKSSARIDAYRRA